MSRSNDQRAGLIAKLNDLLQLDRDALQGYAVAIRNLEHESFRSTVIRFRRDHERHIEELVRLIRAEGGSPAERMHLSTGPLKAGLQQIGKARGDLGVLLTFKANERQMRDKYRRHADRNHPPAVARVLARAAADEEAHYAWATRALEGAGGATDARARKVANFAEGANARMTDAVEAAERVARRAAKRLGRRA